MIWFSVTTPNINSQISVPYNKGLVENSKMFKSVWAEKKNYVTKISGRGRGGTYKERKEQRRSEEFPWSSILPIPEEEEGIVNTFHTWIEFIAFWSYNILEMSCFP